MNIKYNLQKISGILFSELALAFGSIFLSLWIFLKLADSILEKETIFFDQTIITFIYSFRTPFLTSIMKSITFFGSEYFLIFAIILTILFLAKNHKKDAIVFTFILVLGSILNLILKDFFHRQRPLYLPLVHENGFSFPSGHSMNSFIFYTALTYFIFRKMKQKRLGFLFAILAETLVLFIGISRVYLGAHYPSDVFAGFLAGGMWLGGVILFEKLINYSNIFKKDEGEKKY